MAWQTINKLIINRSYRLNKLTGWFCIHHICAFHALRDLGRQLGLWESHVETWDIVETSHDGMPPLEIVP